MTVKELVQKYGLAVSATIPPEAILGPGNVFFVDSGASLALDANNGNAGNSWESPLATLDYAVGLCTANQNDVILLAPGHSESKTTTGNIALLDVAGVHVIGMGIGNVIATFTLGHAGTTLSVTAPNCRIKGIKIASNVADCAIGLTMSALADGAIIEECVFTDGATAKELVIGINVVADCDNIIIRNCRFSTVPSGGCNNAIVLAGGSDGSVIRDNIAYGTYATGTILASVAASANLSIVDNILVNVAAAVGVALNTGSTGVLIRNLIGSAESMANTISGENATYCMENYVTGAPAASGVLDPGVDGD